MIWVLTLLYLPLVAESINDLAWYSPATRSAPLSSNPIFATKSVIDLCQLPPDVGSCSKELIRYYYDAKSDECKRFIFSGCGGNSNRFMRRTHCRSRCVQSKEKLTQVSTEYPNFIAKEIQESKHRRTITTAPTTTTTTTTSTSTLSSTNAAVTRPVQMINKTKITPSIRECPHCDPIYGICIDGDCGCIPGFKKLGRICIDINECDSENICPRNSRCVNTIGSHRCDCDSGFTENGECQITQEACTDPFDINLTEEDCNNGEQLIRYYFDHESMRCKQFFYGGCKSTSRNIFSDIQTCDDLCASTPRDHLKAMSIEDSLHLEEVSTQFPMKLDLGLLNVQSVQTTKMPLEEQKKEAQKIVNIMKEVNPNDNVCLREFDEVLRLECVSAEWNERFLWNYEKKECEPFWYDVSCDARDIAGKNFFETLEECQKTCHEDVDSNEPPKDFTQPKKPIELPSFHPSIEEEGQRNAAENIHSIDRHPLLELHEKHQQLKSEQMQIQQAKTSQPYLTFEIPKPTVTSVSETNFHHIFNHQTEQPTNPEDYEEEEIEDDVRPTPIYRHPLEDIPIDEDTEPKKVRKIKKKKITQAPVIITLPDTTQSVTVTPVATTIQPTEHLQEETIQHTETISNQLKKDIDNQLIEATTQIVQEDTTTPYVKIITLPTHVRLAPGPRMDPSPVDSKTSVPSSFDREQYMIEFKKKLMALPDGSSSSNAESSLSGDPTFVLKPSASAPHRPLFTLPPSVFEEATTVSAIPTTHVTHKHRTHHRHRDSNDIFSTPRDLPTTPEPDFETKEKTKVEETLSELDKLNDRCEEPLHPRLEEDCSNENWVIRWYFNTDKQTCKSFWYGGCDSEARNFFQTVYACKAACAHKYPVEQQSLRPNYFIPGTLATRPPIIIPIIKEDFNFQPTLEVKKQNDQSAFGQKSSASVMLEETAATTHFLPTHPPVSFEQNNVDIALKVIEGPTQKTFYTSYEMEQSEQASESLVPFNDVDSQEKGPVSEDPCDDGFDEKWDEDCSNDDWQVRSYYDSSKKSCKKFWWGGCQTSNRNLWKNQQECTDQCGHKWKTDNDKSTSDAAAEAGAVETKQTESSEQQHQPSEAATITSGSGQKKHHHEHQHRHHHADDNGLLQQSSSINHHQKDTLSEPVKPADEIQQAKDELLQKQAFQADLSRQLAEVKRTQENRSDLLYSKAVNHPVTVASSSLLSLAFVCSLVMFERNLQEAECLDPFDKTLEKSCAGGRQWKNRFYYDPDTRECKMFWNDGCFSTSRNNFDDIESCLWKCAGRHPEPAGRGCLEKFDTNYLGDCRHGEFTTRFHFDHEKKRCVAFHWGGCRSSSLNFFIDIGECEEVCERPPRELTQACIQPFDESYTDSCSADGRFQQFYYFDHSKHACQMFWYGNCKSDNQNIFPTLETCQWICERHVEEKIPGHCAVKFDPKYQESCGNGEWEEKWYFDQIGGECSSFWWDGCTSTSQNIFPNEQSCKRHCVHPGYAVESRMPDPETKYRCLEPVEIGNCRETYPAFYYDRTAKVCRPFAYSGCDGNGNRFMTLSQCEGLCYQFNDMADPEMDCYQPLHIGYGKNDDHCLAQASYRFYYDREYGKCSQFWYLGCGGNANNFHSYEVCQRTCQVERRRLERRPEVNSHVCSMPGAVTGKCPGKKSRPVQRWSYAGKKCVSFTYSGCGGNDNRFASEYECNEVCQGRKASNDPALCSHPPDWGTCNQLRYMWFYNETRGTCDQFLWGGCGGNTNRFESFEICQKACEISGVDPCLESLDRGNWCEAMSNRYYFNKRSKSCRGFHYTGCGKSANNFMTLQECKSKCEARHGKQKRDSPDEEFLDWMPQNDVVGATSNSLVSLDNHRVARQRSSKKKVSTGYSGVKPVVKTPMIRHIVLTGANQTYYRSEPEWYDYALCVGYRYNVSGRDTLLRIHLCALDGNGDCYSQTQLSTNGEEFCEVTRPFMRGTHLYSWYFALNDKPAPYIVGDPKSGRVQRPAETVAVIMILKANHCHDIC